MVPSPFIRGTLPVLDALYGLRERFWGVWDWDGREPLPRTRSAFRRYTARLGLDALGPDPLVGRARAALRTYRRNLPR